MRGSLAVLLLGLVVGFLGPTAVFAEETEKRLAFVVGNGDYPGAKLSTAANDAGLIAQTLQAAGFDVMGARDLEYDVLRQSYREFLQKAAEAGPDAVVFVYLSGYGLQYEGENYFAPIGARIAAASDVPIEALRFSDLTKPLAAVPLKARIFVFDAARENPFAKSGPPLAGGLALADPDPGALIAFNATPGTVAPGQTEGAYGAYAQALAEMMREGGLPIDDVFDRVRLRVNEVTKGGQVAWDASKITAPFTFFERAADAPPVAAPGPEAAFLREKPIRDFPAQEAYAAALERDSVQGYEAFLAAYPDDPMARRVRALLAARREAITWRQTALADSPDAYWSYLRRYPRGPHVSDARRRLAHFSAALEPPPSFEMMSYDIAPPPPAEIVYVDRPVLVFSDPFYDFAPPPPVFFLPPPTVIVIAPPPWPVQPFLLPVPVFVPLPVYVNPPVYVAAPSNDFYFRNRHLPVVAAPVADAPAPSPGIPNGPGPVVARPFVGLPAAVRERAGGRGQSTPGLGTGIGPGSGANFGQGLHGRPPGGLQPPPGARGNLPSSSGTLNAPTGGTPVLRDGVAGSKEQGLKELPKNDALSNGARRGHQLPAVGGRPLPGTIGARPGSSGAPDAQSVGAGAIPKEGLIGSQEQGHRRGSSARRGQPPSSARGQALPGASGQPAPEAIGNPPDASGAQRARGAGAGRRDGVASPQGHGVRQGPSSGAGGGQPHAGPRLQETAPRQGQIHQQPLNATQQRQQLMEQQQRQIQAPPQQHMQQRQHQAPSQQQMQQRQYQAPPQQMQQRQFQAPQQQHMQQRQFQAPQQQQMQQRQYQAPPQQHMPQRQFQAPPQQQMPQRQIQAPPQQQQRRVQPIPGQPQ
ncbi:caspase family protein [Methylocapsa aurea]|uniref:caspase family protein n=1 Tax=Methylocapsa aurea TaxID=663610 RepID=UPI0006904DE7|nr:caspase domain-containing protein [Methylocapsa aurea]